MWGIGKLAKRCSARGITTIEEGNGEAGSGGIPAWKTLCAGGKIIETARDGGPMLDPEAKRAWHRLGKEVKDNVPVVLRGLASSGKRLPSRVYKATVRGCKFLITCVREWNAAPGGRKALVSQLSRVRLRSPIYKV